VQICTIAVYQSGAAAAAAIANERPTLEHRSEGVRNRREIVASLLHAEQARGAKHVANIACGGAD
jgi:hypothetical protein